MSMYGQFPVRKGRERIRLAISKFGPTMAKQSEAAACDINNIMKRYERDGLIEHVNKYHGDYGDFTDVPDYHAAMNKVIAVDAMFMSLPAGVRSRFDNDPAKFLSFVDDPKNGDELLRMGLREVKPVADPLRVEVVNPPVAPAPSVAPGS